MTEWTVVTVIIALVGLVSVFTSSAVKMSAASTRLTAAVDRLDKNLTDLTDRNAKSHSRIFDKLDDHEAALVEHDKRITILEHDKEG